MRRDPLPSPLRSAIRAVLAAALHRSAGPRPAAAKKRPSSSPRQAENTTLGKTILTTLKGRTLYSLSAETNGKFICTASCALDLAATPRSRGRETHRPGEIRHGQTTRRQDPGRLQGPPALRL